MFTGRLAVDSATARGWGAGNQRATVVSELRFSVIFSALSAFSALRPQSAGDYPKSRGVFPYSRPDCGCRRDYRGDSAAGDFDSARSVFIRLRSQEWDGWSPPPRSLARARDDGTWRLQLSRSSPVPVGGRVQDLTSGGAAAARTGPPMRVPRQSPRGRVRKRPGPTRHPSCW
jgi:hypothetical protein